MKKFVELPVGGVSPVRCINLDAILYVEKNGDHTCKVALPDGLLLEVLLSYQEMLELLSEHYPD